MRDEICTKKWLTYATKSPATHANKSQTEWAEQLLSFESVAIDGLDCFRCAIWDTSGIATDAFVITERSRMSSHLTDGAGHAKGAAKTVFQVNESVFSNEVFFTETSTSGSGGIHDVRQHGNIHHE